ncbi:GNAT family N-acetyltransferase [Parafilimonas sp.]|uniref:GNAT family N-acetyltransferase n=1 Tax=Parafilimonas sp. TaxID=1969739 RepID=UPI0039E72298
MEISIAKANVQELQPLRDLFLHENKIEFVYNKCHLYGWADTYAFTIDNVITGYGAVWGKDKREDRDTIFEFYMIEAFRKYANLVFKKFKEACGATFIECQSNDVLLFSLLCEHAQNIHAGAILFEDSFQTNFYHPQLLFEKNKTPGSHPDDRSYILKLHGETVAAGGLMLNYNKPYADIYYEVKENHRRKGYGSFMLQLLKQEAYAIQRVPAARCHIKNNISKAALLKAGFKTCGFMLTGEIKKEA